MDSLMRTDARQGSVPSLTLLPGCSAAASGRDLIRPYHAVDRPVVLADLLPVLRQSYSCSTMWLPRRLDDVLAYSARCHLARDLRGLRAIAIETPKGRGRLKLSTIWVADRAREKGLGSELLAASRARWLCEDLQQVWVTVSPAARGSMSKLLLANGFTQTAVDTDRYGSDRPETIFTWYPHQDPSARSGDYSAAA
jgi:GNAT superfamily N-acetyltransferase